MFPLRACLPLKPCLRAGDFVFQHWPMCSCFELPLPKSPVAWSWVVADSTAASAIALWQGIVHCHGHLLLG